MANQFHVNKKQLQPHSSAVVPIKRQIPKWWQYFLGLLIVIPLIYFLIKMLPVTTEFTASGFITFEQLSVRSPENGYIDRVYVNVGQQVAKGDALLDFYAPHIDKQIQQLEIEKQVLLDLRRAAGNQQLDFLRQMQASAQQQLLASRKHYQKFQQLRRRGIVNMIQEDNALDDVRRSEIQLDDIKRQIKASESAHRHLLESQYDEKIRKIYREIAQLEDKKDFFKIKAQQRVTVIDVFVHEREYTTAGQLLINLSTNENLQVHAFVDPEIITDIQLDKHVTIVLPSGQRVGGTILHMPRFSNSANQPSRRLKETEQKIVLIIKPDEQIPEKYHIFGVPVKVIF